MTTLPPLTASWHRWRRAVSLTTLIILGMTLVAAPAAAFYHKRAPAPAARQAAPGAGVAAVVNLTDSLRFTPATVTIKVGQTVEWRNGGGIRHTVTADPRRNANARIPNGARAFDSGWVNGGRSFRVTFNTPGVYEYVCLPHDRAGMRGKVVVRR